MTKMYPLKEDLRGKTNSWTLKSGVLISRSGIPGVLRGLECLHKSYASRPWRKLIQPAINLTRHGSVVSYDLIRTLARLDCF
jgi:gamma-glutamyltranspeptidase